MLIQWLENRIPDDQNRREYWQTRLLVLVAISLFIVLGTLSIAFPSLQEVQTNLELEVGGVAPRDILSPRSLTFTSEVKTQEARQAAINSVQAIYDANPDATRNQIRYARAVVAYVNEVRHDSYATLEQKVEDLLLIEELTLNDEVWETALQMPDVRWDLMSNEIVALVERTMQREIRPNTLDTVRNVLINSVASRFSNSEAEIIVSIARDMVQANSFFNEEGTKLRQEEAANAVSVQERSYEKGQLIIRSGNLVTEADMEALRQFGFLTQRGVEYQVLVGAFLAMVIVIFIISLYLDRFHHDMLRDPQMVALIATLFLITLSGVNLLQNQPYFYPAAAMGLLYATFVSPQMGILASAALAILANLTLGASENSLEILAYIFIGSLAGIIILRRTDRLTSYFFAGIAIGITHIAVMLVFVLSADSLPSFSEALAQGIILFTNGLFAGLLAVAGLFVITLVTNLPTALKLNDLTSAQQPLLQKLLREAPGTYQHSLQVANLSGLAAEAIGADAELVRAAALYHDIGKTLNPFFFGENTPEGINPHAELNDPLRSAKVIIGHVVEGEKIARKAKLPERIRDFILEHHGTTQVLYFYNQAIDLAKGDENLVDRVEFTYPGPSPRSRETAIMMLADGCESATRSARPASKHDVERMVNTIFELRMSEGQLDYSGLTLNDIKTIRQVFIQTLQAMYHPRIAYQMRHRSAQDAPQQLTAGFVKHLERASRQNSNILDTSQQRRIKAAIDSSLPASVEADKLKLESDPTTIEPEDEI